MTRSDPSARTVRRHQVRELRPVAERRGWEIVGTHSDDGISGAKDRDKRPGLDAMLKEARRSAHIRGQRGRASRRRSGPEALAAAPHKRSSGTLHKGSRGPTGPEH
jgi:hypothetical protein